jgi:hypothetical protein
MANTLIRWPVYLRLLTTLRIALVGSPGPQAEMGALGRKMESGLELLRRPDNWTACLANSTSVCSSPKRGEQYAG